MTNCCLLLPVCQNFKYVNSYSRKWHEILLKQFIRLSQQPLDVIFRIFLCFTLCLSKKLLSIHIHPSLNIGSQAVLKNNNYSCIHVARYASVEHILKCTLQRHKMPQHLIASLSVAVTFFFKLVNHKLALFREKIILFWQLFLLITNMLYV